MADVESRAGTPSRPGRGGRAGRVPVRSGRLAQVLAGGEKSLQGTVVQGLVILFTGALDVAKALPGVPVQLVPLPAAFRTHGNGLVADEAVWAGVRDLVPTTRNAGRVGPFASDYHDVLLPGESVPVALTPAQSAFVLGGDAMAFPARRPDCARRAEARSR